MFKHDFAMRLGLIVMVLGLTNACTLGQIGELDGDRRVGSPYVDNDGGVVDNWPSLDEPGLDEPEAPGSEPGSSIVPVCSETSPDVSARHGWLSSEASAPAVGQLYFEFKARSDSANLDGLVAVGAETINAFNKAAIAVRFAEDGYVDARDGSSYGSDVSYPYEPGVWYTIAVSADITDETYDVEIGPCGEPRQPLIKSAAFRANADIGAQLRTWAVWSSQTAALEVSTPMWMASGACAPATCESLGQACGGPSNGCGGTLDCGGCGSGDTCVSGVCVDSPVPPPVEPTPPPVEPTPPPVEPTPPPVEPTPPPVEPTPPPDGGQGDRPWSHNTGPTDEGALVAVASPTITVDGTVLENIEVTGRIKIDADNVTIRNFRVNATSSYGIHIVNGHSGIVLEDGEISGSDSACIFGVGYTARRIHAHDGNGDILKVQGSGGSTLIEYSFIEKAGADGEGHADGNQTAMGSGANGSNSSITFRYNNIWMPSPGTPSYVPPYKSNANFMLEDGISNFFIENNWLNGGNYTIYCRDGSETGVFVRNNIFGRDHNYGPKIGTCAQWSGNVWEDTGQPL